MITRIIAASDGITLEDLTRDAWVDPVTHRTVIASQDAPNAVPAPVAAAAHRDAPNAVPAPVTATTHRDAPSTGRAIVDVTAEFAQPAAEIVALRSELAALRARVSALESALARHPSAGAPPDALGGGGGGSSSASSLASDGAPPPIQTVPTCAAAGLLPTTAPLGASSVGSEDAAYHQSRLAHRERVQSVVAMQIRRAAFYASTESDIPL